MGVKTQLFEVGAYRLDFCLWGWMKSEVYKGKVNTRDKLVARIMDSAALIKQERQDDLRRATRTIQEGWKVHCSRWWDFWALTLNCCNLLEIIYITNKSNQYVTCLSCVPFVKLFMRNIQTAVSPHPMKIGHMFIWTYLLGMVHIIFTIPLETPCRDHHAYNPQVHICIREVPS